MNSVHVYVVCFITPWAMTQVDLAGKVICETCRISESFINFNELSEDQPPVTTQSDPAWHIFSSSGPTGRHGFKSRSTRGRLAGAGDELVNYTSAIIKTGDDATY